ncbi:MAG: exosome complex RNA-binding protein Csl4 [Nitrososphaerales archaeon]
MSNHPLISEKSKRAVPGDMLAVIEEFSSSKGTYINGSSIRASKLGMANYNLKKKEIKIEPLKKIKVPMVGDSVIGQVEAVQSNIANIRIYYINNERSLSNFVGMLVLKSESPMRRGREKAIICKLGDIIRAKVTSCKNAIVHLSINGDENGVVYAKCSLCGGNMNKIGQRVKCVECGFIEDRKLAFDFGEAYLK